MVFKVALITSISFEVYPFPLTVPVILNPRGLSRLQISDRFLLHFKIKSTPNPPLPPCFHKTNKQTNQPTIQPTKQTKKAFLRHCYSFSFSHLDLLGE